MRFDPILADCRFGCGRSPDIAPPEDAAAMLSGLSEPDGMLRAYPVETFDAFLLRMQAYREVIKVRRANRGMPEGDAARKQARLLNKDARQAQMKWMAAHIARRVHSATPMRERLESFWADHFTATGKRGLIRRATTPYVASAIRPHISGRFEDMLIEAVTHPVMVHYLDQASSAGPNSEMAQRRPHRYGLNENLAREVLELHSLGADGPYTQADVRQLAELLSGLTLNVRVGRQFRKPLAEPGPETVLGKSYGGSNAHIRDIHAVLRDLARHPATAGHIAGKLAVHFVSDTPEPALIAAMKRAWIDTDGDLLRVYEAMLTHPAAWDPDVSNFKLPFDFISSACRALAVPHASLADLREGVFRQRIQQPLAMMGHIWQKPDGPDGLDEADAAWITPQSMAARLQWALAVPQVLVADLPDPRDFVRTALGPRATERVQFAARAAESRADGVGLVLASPAFQRM